MTDDTPSQRRITSDTGPFAIVPEWVLDLPVSDRAVRLYAILSRYADADGFSWPSRRTLAERLGRSVDALDRAVKELVESGALVVSARFDGAGDRTSNGYSVMRMRPAEERVGGREDAATGSRETAATGSRETAALMRAKENETQEERDGSAVAERGHPEVATARRRDVVWETVMEVCGIDPTQITSSSRGAYNRAVRDLRDLGAGPEAIVVRATVFRRRWPEASLTPTALARRWPECDPERQHGTRAPVTRAEQDDLARLMEAWETT